MDNNQKKFNREWIFLNATRELLKIANRGDARKSTYNDAFDFGGQMYPELLGKDVSLLRKERLSNLAKEYKQKARHMSIREKREIKAVDLIVKDISDYKTLINLDPKEIGKEEKDQLVKKIAQLHRAKEELEPIRHTENQLIIRDVYNVDRGIPTLPLGKAAKTYKLPNMDNFRIRLLHPEKPEHITGADLIYEYHHLEKEVASIIFIQYKIWEDRKLYLSDKRLKGQLERLEAFTCSKGLCECSKKNNGYRFPFCAGFLRPTDALQKASQALVSRGEYIPICKIEAFKTIGRKGGEYLEYEKIREVSLPSLLFEDLFNRGKIGSKRLSYDELSEIYLDSEVIERGDTVVIYAQDYLE